ncbi:MAG: tetratricopeptide repeat protein [Candidatus Tectomicrobia bacterium]|nr:tetratricopeptide repeat protein [Candidatus Tectomicrobia bacterium]
MAASFKGDLPRDWLRWLAPLLIAALGFLIYAGTFHAPFHLDDAHGIVRNEWIRDLWGTVQRIARGEMRSVVWFSFAVNYSLHGLALPGYHLGNILIHLGNALLVVWLTLLLCRTQALRVRQAAADGRWIALAAGLFFVAHPLQVQSVTYLVQRLESLAAGFYLLSVGCYLQARLRRGAPEGGGRRSWGCWYGAALAAGVAAMLSKETALTLPGAIALLELCLFPGVRRDFKGRFLFASPFILVGLIVPISVFFSYTQPAESIGSGVSRMAGGEPSLAGGVSPYTRSEYLLTQARVLVAYLRLTLLPTWQNVDADVGASTTLWEWRTLGSLALLLALFGGALRRLRRWPLQATGLFWMLLVLSPRSSLLPFRDALFEHRLYLPLAGAAVALAATYVGAVRLVARRGLPVWPVLACGVLVAALLAGLTARRNYTWASAPRLWEDTVRKSPRKPRPHNNLGNAYEAVAAFDRAMAEYKTALARFPTFAEAHNNLAVVYHRRGRYADAAASARTALRYWSSYEAAKTTLAAAYLQLGRPTKALAAALAAVHADRRSAAARDNLGMAYLQHRFHSRAARALFEALTLAPQQENAWSHLGDLLGVLGRDGRGRAGGISVWAYRAALRRNAANALTWNSLGSAWFSERKMERAASAFLQALALKPDYAKAWSNLGNLYAQRRRLAAARRALQAALRLDPASESAHINLGSLLSQEQRYDAAILQFHLALQLDATRLESIFNLASMLAARGRHAQALAWYEQFQRHWRGAPSLAQLAGEEIRRLRRALAAPRRRE